jgi:hypothetical protein
MSPALDGRVILRRNTIEHHCPVKKRLTGQVIRPRASGKLILNVVFDWI